MRRFLASSLIVSVLIFVTTLAGMAVFGMGANMDMGSHACAGTVCVSTTDMGHAADAAGLDCINHCLSSASVPMTNALPLQMVLTLVLLVALIAENLAPIVSSLAPSFRWREGIGKHLLHLRLSTVILRN